MKTWVYKCNSNRVVGDWEGDWVEPFCSAVGDEFSWGTKGVPGVSQLAAGDRILAYQTDLNELIGVARVVGFKSGHLILKTIERIGVKVRPLKDDPKIAAIHAFSTRQPKTIYDITEKDANYLLQVARRHSIDWSKVPGVIS